MQVIGRRRVFLSLRVPEVGGDEGFVRALVLGETNVAIYPHHRSAIGARINQDLRVDLLKMRLEIRNQAQKGIANILLKPLSVAFEPASIVIAPEFLEECKKLAT